MPLLLPGASQSDLGSYLYPGTRKTHLIPGYIYFSNDHQSPLLGTRPQTLLYKVGRERGLQVSFSEARKNFYLWYCYGSLEQGKSISGSLIYREFFLQVIFVPHSQEATQYFTSGPLFQASQQWQVNQWWAQEVSWKQPVPLLRCRRPQARLLSQEPWCFSNCFWETLRKIESNLQDSAQTEGHIELLCATTSPTQLNASTLSDPHLLFVSLIFPLILG